MLFTEYYHQMSNDLYEQYLPKYSVNFIYCLNDQKVDQWHSVLKIYGENPKFFLMQKASVKTLMEDLSTNLTYCPSGTITSLFFFFFNPPFLVFIYQSCTCLAVFPEVSMTHYLSGSRESHILAACAFNTDCRNFCKFL